MYPDLTLLAKCGAADYNTCVSTTHPECKWYPGKQLSSNQQLELHSTTVSPALFVQNFCHPPTLESWDTLAPQCLSNQDAQSCGYAQCVWSNGRELVPPEGDFCQVRDISLSPSDYSNCAKEVATTCSSTTATGNCRWYCRPTSTSIKPSCGLSDAEWDLDTCSYKCPPPPAALFSEAYCHPR
jgi:hypothetical protein